MGAKFDHDVFVQQIKDVINTAGLDSNDRLRNSNPSACKTFVVAVNTLVLGRPILMRSYDNPPSAEAFDCMIWEAARATSAAPTFFLPIDINGIKYSDGGVGFNNPTELLVEEVDRIWPGRSIACLVSIGTGQHGPIQLEKEPKSLVWKVLSWLLPSLTYKIDVAKSCVRIATSGHNKHLKLMHKPDIGSIYFRFDVPQGMSNIGLHEWEKLDQMKALTKSYMENEVLNEKERLARLLLSPSFAGRSPIINNLIDEGIEIPIGELSSSNLLRLQS